MKKTVLMLSALATIGAVTFNSCKKSDDPASTSTSSLYDRVGGTTSVTDPNNKGQMIEKGRLTLRSVVDSAILVIAADAKLNNNFFPTLLAEVGNGNTTGFAALSKNFTDFLQDATGRPTKVYAGKSMKDAHNPALNTRMNMKATAVDFTNFIGDIGKSLTKNGVTDQALINDLVALLNTTMGDVVQGTPATMSLYDQVGGTTMVDDPTSTTTPKAQIEKGRLTLRTVTNDAIGFIGADPKMASFFPTLLAELGANPPVMTGYNALSKNFTDFLCYATGSKTIAYYGKSMKNAHNPANNSRMGAKAAAADFDNFIGDVAKALNKNGVATGTQLFNDLAALLNTTKPDVIQK